MLRGLEPYPRWVPLFLEATSTSLTETQGINE